MATERNRYRVLVVDDDEAVSLMLRQMLRHLGCSSISRSNPVEALAMVRSAPARFDAVIVDEMMPVMRGTELAIQLIEINDDIPVVLLTGHADLIPLERVQASGVRATLAKPVSKEQLREVLDRVLKAPQRTSA